MNGIGIIATSFYAIFRGMEKDKVIPMVSIPLSEYERMREEISNKKVIFGKDIDHANKMLIEDIFYLNQKLDLALKEKCSLQKEIKQTNEQINVLKNEKEKFILISIIESIFILILVVSCALLMK